jgi:hypothetical protein
MPICRQQVATQLTAEINYAGSFFLIHTLVVKHIVKALIYSVTH